MTTSFIQYQRCELCRISHNKGRKHIYSGRHTKVVTNILMKFSKKVQRARTAAKSPVVTDLLADGVDTRFWCYFCAEELPRHLELDGASVESGGLLAHIGSVEHEKNTATFWKVNRVADKQMMSTFQLSEKDLDRFKTTALECVERFHQDQHRRLTEEAAVIRAEVHQRCKIVSLPMDMKWRFREAQSAQVGSFMQAASKPDRQGVVTPVRTIAAHGEGLMCVSIKNIDESVGNIHSGALPPWLQDNDDDGEVIGPPKIIGPTINDLEKHKEREKKRKLPKIRVGAKFDRTGPQNDGWLPSFGRVWSKNRRSHQKSFASPSEQQRRPPKFGSGQSSVGGFTSFSMNGGTVNHGSSENVGSVVCSKPSPLASSSIRPRFGDNSWSSASSASRFSDQSLTSSGPRFDDQPLVQSSSGYKRKCQLAATSTACTETFRISVAQNLL